MSLSATAPPTFPTDAALDALAQIIGAHALDWYLAGLAIVLLAVTLVEGSLRRRAARREHAGTPLVAAFALKMGLGFVVIVGAGLLFGAIAGEIGAGGRLVYFDQAFSDAVQRSTPESARRVFGWITHLGDPLTLWIVCVAGAAALFARGERLLAFALVAAIAGNAILNITLKGIFARIRPLQDPALTSFAGFSFPSGHSSGAVVAYGMLAYVLICTTPRSWHLPWVLLTATTAYAVGSSRVIVHAHFATDVVAGFASGTAWLAICIISVEWTRRRQRRAHAPKQPGGEI